MFQLDRIITLRLQSSAAPSSPDRAVLPNHALQRGRAPSMSVSRRLSSVQGPMIIMHAEGAVGGGSEFVD
jgi:hypothetical protein